MPFQDQPVINGCWVVGAEMQPVGIQAATPDRDPVTATPALYSVTWNDGSDHRHEDVPVSTLIASFNGGIYKEYIPFRCDFQKSRVTYRGVNPTIAVEAVPFTIYFVRPEDMDAFRRLMGQLQ